MKTGFHGTFVISWSQTEVDGLQAAPLDMLMTGAVWRWSGVPVRVDGARDVLLLQAAEGIADMRRRAAQSVRRLVGMAVEARTPVDPVSGPDEAPEQGFTVTDGRHSHAVTIIDVPDTGARLLMFFGDVPPPDTDLWIVRTAIEPQGTRPARQGASGVICFVPGTRITTPGGTCRIEELRPGDLIQTKDNGPQEVLWTGSRHMTGARLYAMPHLRPIRFRTGALGQGRPDGDLLVSPQHRMLVSGRSAQALFNTPEVLVAAEDLLNDHSVTVDHMLREVTYVHVLLEHHQIVWANGLETESFHPSNTELATVDPSQRDTLLSLVPELADDPLAYGGFARRNLTTPEAAILRHDMRG